MPARDTLLASVRARPQPGEYHTRNQSEMGAPLASATGQAFRRAVVPARVVREMAPLIPRGQLTRFRNVVGTLLVRSARPRMVIAPKGYLGELPLAEQRVIQKPHPWDDPTRGAP